MQANAIMPRRRIVPLRMPPELRRVDIVEPPESKGEKRRRGSGGERDVRVFRRPLNPRPQFRNRRANPELGGPITIRTRVERYEQPHVQVEDIPNAHDNIANARVIPPAMPRNVTVRLRNDMQVINLRRFFVGNGDVSPGTWTWQYARRWSPNIPGGWESFPAETRQLILQYKDHIRARGDPFADEWMRRIGTMAVPPQEDEEQRSERIEGMRNDAAAAEQAHNAGIAAVENGNAGEREHHPILPYADELGDPANAQRDPYAGERRPRDTRAIDTSHLHYSSWRTFDNPATQLANMGVGASQARIERRAGANYAQQPYRVPAGDLQAQLHAIAQMPPEERDAAAAAFDAEDENDAHESFADLAQPPSAVAQARLADADEAMAAIQRGRRQYPPAPPQRSQPLQQSGNSRVATDVAMRLVREAQRPLQQSGRGRVATDAVMRYIQGSQPAAAPVADAEPLSAPQVVGPQLAPGVAASDPVNASAGIASPEDKYQGIPLRNLELLLERGFLQPSERKVLEGVIKKMREAEASVFDPRTAIEELLNPDEPNPILRAGRNFEQAQMGAPARQIHKRVREVFETGYGTRGDQYDDAGYVPDRESTSNPLIRNIKRADDYYEAGMPDMNTLLYKTALQDRDAYKAQKRIATDTTRAFVQQSMEDRSVYAEAARNRPTRYDNLVYQNRPSTRIDPHQEVDARNSEGDWMSAMFRR